MQSYDVTAQSTAPPDAVWALLLDPKSWPAWSRIDALESGQSRDLSPDGRDDIGATRAFRTGNVVVTERITALQPRRRFAYEGVENPQMAGYRAVVELHELPGGGTRIRWHGTYQARRGTRWVFQWYLRRFMQAMVTGLAEHAADLDTPLTTQKGNHMQQSVEAISAIPARMNEAWNRGDATAFFADFADDAEFADFEGTIYRGREQMIATHQPIFDTVMKGSRLLRGEVPFARIIGSACGVVHHRVGIALPGEKEPPPSRYSMQLFVMGWQDDHWEVVALQNSRLISLEAVAALESANLRLEAGRTP